MQFKAHLQQNTLLVRAARPASVICRASRLSDLRDVKVDNFLKPLSVTTVKDRFILSSFVKPARKDETKIKKLITDSFQRS